MIVFVFSVLLIQNAQFVRHCFRIDNPTHARPIPQWWQCSMKFITMRIN